jgi:hypothetical protein
VDNGYHPDLPAEQYFALHRLSASGAKLILHSPLHYQHDRASPRTETPALKLGTAAHMAVAEPDRYSLEVATLGPCDRRTKAGKEYYNAFMAANEGKIILSEDEARIVEGMAKSVHSHPLAAKLLEGAAVEVSMLWRDPATGCDCKGRMDLFKPDAGAILDIKTTLDASPSGFAKQALNFGYHIQAAAYLSGANTLGADIRDFIIIAVEKSPPFACAVYRLSDAHLELGHRRWAEACSTYQRCTESGEWPGYGDTIQELTLPNWAANELYIDPTEET